VDDELQKKIIGIAIYQKLREANEQKPSEPDPFPFYLFGSGLICASIGFAVGGKEGGILGGLLGFVAVILVTWLSYRGENKFEVEPDYGKYIGACKHCGRKIGRLSKVCRCGRLVGDHKPKVKRESIIQNGKCIHCGHKIGRLSKVCRCGRVI